MPASQIRACTPADVSSRQPPIASIDRRIQVKTYQLYINGQYVDPANGEWFDSIDPYRGEAWGRFRAAPRPMRDKAVAAANEAMWRGPWSKMTASARGKVMRKLGDLVAANAERLAEIEVRDNGKLMAEMLGQLRYHPEWWWYSADARKLLRADRQAGDLCLHHA